MFLRLVRLYQKLFGRHWPFWAFQLSIPWMNPEENLCCHASCTVCHHDKVVCFQLLLHHLFMMGCKAHYQVVQHLKGGRTAQCPNVLKRCYFSWYLASFKNDSRVEQLLICTFNMIDRSLFKSMAVSMLSRLNYGPSWTSGHTQTFPAIFLCFHLLHLACSTYITLFRYRQQQHGW